MKIKFVTPPPLDFTSPYLSTACLTAFLKMKGLNAEQYDMNLEVMDYIFSREYMTLCLEELKAKGAASSKLDLVEYLADNIEECKNTLRSESGVDKNVSKSCYNFLRLTQSVVNDLWKNEVFLSNKYKNDKYTLYDEATVSECIDDVLTGKCESRLCNIMKRFVDELVKDTEVIGISVPFTAQLFPSFMLAALCKAANPEIKIVMGGTLATTWTKNIEAIRPMFRVVDYFSFFEGERSIEGLMRHLIDGSPIENVPSLCYLKDDEIVLNPSDEHISMNELPTPVYEKKYIPRYFSPRPILPLLTCRGCYWNRCSFCSHGAIYRNCYRTRNPKLVADDIETYIKEYGAKHISFNDEAISAPMLKKVSQEIIDRKLDIVWSNYARFDKGLSKEIIELAHDAGLRRLCFGLESYNERVLTAMNKGIKREFVEPIIKNCYEAGIWNHLFFIVGFPTETYEEFQESCDFVKRNLKYIHVLAFNPFYASKFSDVVVNPDKYDIVLTDKENEPLRPFCNIEEKPTDRNTTFKNRTELASGQGIGLRFFNQWRGRETPLLYMDDLLESCKKVASGYELLSFGVSPLFSKSGKIEYAYITQNNKDSLIKVGKTNESHLSVLSKYDFKDEAINELSKLTGYPPALAEVFANQLITAVCGKSSVSEVTDK